MFAFNDLSGFDDLYRLRRQMNDIFSEFDHHFGMASMSDPFFNDPFFNRSLPAPGPHQLQPRLTHSGKELKGEEKYASAASEQKADANTMTVEPTNSPSPTPATTGDGTGDSSNALTHTQHQSNAPALLRSRNQWLAPFPKIHMPRCDVVENADNYLVTCDLPGMTKEDVKLSINDHGVMTISAERSSSTEQKDPQAKYHRVERHYGKFERSLPLPKNVELEQVSAKHENGLLKISLPKKHQLKADGTKMIQIQ